MKRTLYALLVGIDEYPNPQHRLRGCVNDIDLIGNYLSKRLSEKFILKVKRIANRQATRKAVITGFTKHLSRAGSNDVALFYFSGHGSQTDTRPEYYVLEPSKKDQTIVCWDSREPGGTDIVDKELAVLIAKLAKGSSHITVILDCCHSGSGTRVYRECGIRTIPPDERQRAPETYLYAPTNLKYLLGGSDKSLANGGLPMGPHILLAACLSRQGAAEYCPPLSSKIHGIFSYFLHQTLMETSRALTYHEVIQRTRALVSGHILDQDPQMESYGETNPSAYFLSGAAPGEEAPYFTVSYHTQLDHWVIDGGAVHGVQPPQLGGEKTVIALFPFSTANHVIKNLKQAVTTASVVEVSPELSKIEITGCNPSALDTNKTYKGIIAGLPLPPAKLRIEGDLKGRRLAKQVFKKSLASNGTSHYLAIDEASPDYRLIAENGEYLIVRPIDDQLLVEKISGYSEVTAATAIARLEHIARWQQTFDLARNPRSILTDDSVELSIRYQDKDYSDGMMQLHYGRINREWKPPQIRIKLRNTGSEPLYCALLGLTELFSVSTLILSGGGVWLAPNEEVQVNQGRPIIVRIPQELADRQQTRDWIKLIACTAAFNPHYLRQAKIHAAPVRSRAILGDCCSTLQRLLARIQTREIVLTRSPEDVYDEWLTKQIAIVTTRGESAVE